MKASELIRTWPGTGGELREHAIEAAVIAGHFLPLKFSAVQSVIPGHRALLYVSADALRLGEPDDFIRVSVSHATAQKLADTMGLRLGTAKISDLTHGQASVILPPRLMTPDNMMASTTRMVEYNKLIEESREGREGLLSTLGKDWVLTNQLTTEKAANYGWHGTGAKYISPGGMRLWQPVGLAHNTAHVDYSQTLRLIWPKVIVDGNQMMLEQVLQDPELSALVSYEGPLKFTRHPGVPEQPQSVSVPFEVQEAQAQATSPFRRPWVILTLSGLLGLGLYLAFRRHR